MTKAQRGSRRQPRRSRAPKGPSGAQRTRAADLTRQRFQEIFARLSVIETYLNVRSEGTFGLHPAMQQKLESNPFGNISDEEE